MPRRGVQQQKLQSALMVDAPLTVMLLDSALDPTKQQQQP
jgi:hypothetical protein